MGDNNYARRTFFQKLTNNDQTAGAAGDKLFEKYARKQIGSRHYSEALADADGTEGSTGTTANRSGNVTSGLTPYTGTWTEAEVTHLLRRIGFGAKKADGDTYAAMTMSAAVDALLTIPVSSATTPAYATTLPTDTPLNNYNASYADSSAVAIGADWTKSNLSFASGSNDSSVEYQRQVSLTSWSWGVCINDGTIIREKMVNFWYHFIPVNFDDVRGMVNNSATACHQYMKLLRDNALGNYSTLIRAIAKSPAMLVYLSNQYSTANAPNENFARELMELFMLGKAPTQNYTEDDIKAAAKVLSGWRVTSFTSAFPFTVTFNSTYHNSNTPQRTFSSFFAVPPLTYNTINYQAGTAGAGEFDLFFDMLFDRQGLTIAKYVCRRLYRFFVYYDIDSNVEANVISPLAATFMSSNWEILPVIKQLLKSEHFYDMANRGVMIKSPLDLLAGVVRTLKIETNSTAGVANQYTVWNTFQSKANAMEQAYGLVPNVSGWKAYYQSPSFYQNWINTNTVQQRYSLLSTLCGNGFGTGTGGLVIKLDVFAAVQQFPNVRVRLPDDLINLLVTYLLPMDLDATYKFGANGLKQRTLLGNLTSDHYWTDIWDIYTATPATGATTAQTNNKATVKSRLTALLSELLQLPEFQLM